MVPSECNFGHSLLAGFSPHYLSDFTLHGTSDPHFHTRLHQDLTQAVQNPVLDESITEAACVVADTDKWYVSTGHFSTTSVCLAMSANRTNLFQLLSSEMKPIVMCFVKKLLFSHI